jgi:hypothetical protein
MLPISGREAVQPPAEAAPTMIRSHFGMLALVVVAPLLSGCGMAEEQTAYRSQQRQECVAAGGYFEENKIGAPDNYTCKNLRGSPPVAVAPARTPAPATNCQTNTTTTKNPDGSVETKTSQVCSSS